MAIKTFGTNELLTSSDTNTFLANGGLVCLSKATVTGTTNVFNNIFPAGVYTNFRVNMDIASGVTATNNLQFITSGGVATATGYHYSGLTLTPGVTTNISTNVAGGNTSFIAFCTSGASISSFVIADFFLPNTTSAKKGFISQATSRQTNAAGSTTMYGGNPSATQFAGFQIVSSSTATISITVYGYRNV